MAADNAVKTNKFKKALKKYQKILEEDSDNKHALMGVAYTTLIIGENHQLPSSREKYFQMSIEHAQQAYKMSAMSTDANYMMALILDKQAEFVSDEKILGVAQDMKKHAEYALRFEPENAGAYFLLGRAYYIMATIPFELRTDEMASVQENLQTSIDYYKKAIALNSKRVLFYYALALAYEEDLRSEEALASINQALSLNPTPEDGGESILMRCQELKFMID